MFSFFFVLYLNKPLFYFTWIDKSSATLRETSGYELLGIYWKIPIALWESSLLGKKLLPTSWYSLTWMVNTVD